MANVTFNQNVLHRGRLYLPGDSADVSDADAQYLRDTGLVEGGAQPAQPPQEPPQPAPEQMAPVAQENETPAQPAKKGGK